jgi:hypothetical protein
MTQNLKMGFGTKTKKFNMKLHRYKFNLKDYKNFDSEKRSVLLFEDKNCDDLLDIFYTRVSSSISEKNHCPIIRLADGEFQFLLGTNEFNIRKPFHKLVYHLIKQYLDKIFKPSFEARSRTYTSGVYSHSDKRSVKEQYAECLKHVSEDGVLAIYTIVKPKFYSEQYLSRLFSFLDKLNIELNNKNYIPFYFIYIILTNPKYSKIYKDKNVHLITSFDDERKSKIERTLKSLGVKSITWTKISRDRSLFDTVNANDINQNVDIIFVGAGIGKVNIFNQLKGIKTLIIDAGYIFETWQNPALTKERDYCKVHASNPFE